MKMKRCTWVLCFLVVVSTGGFAQRHTIYVDDFKSEIKVPDRVLALIRLAFIDGIYKTNRLNIVDAVATGNDPNIRPLEDARRYRADYLLVADLLEREATDDGNTHWRYHSRENSYKEKFKLRIDLIRTSDGVTIGTRNYEQTGSAWGKDATQYSALENALIDVPYEIGIFVENYFKVYGSIIRVVTTKKNKAKTVYINLGYDDPIKAGLRLDVVEKGILEGDSIEREIGEVRIKEVMGPRISLCKVNKGKEAIGERLREGKTLRLISRQARLFDEWRRTQEGDDYTKAKASIRSNP